MPSNKLLLEMVFDIKIPISAFWPLGRPSDHRPPSFLSFSLSHSELITLICQAATVGPENRAEAAGGAVGGQRS